MNNFSGTNINISDLTALTNLMKNKNLRVFFSGIGGISMSAIAAALHQKGYTVGGSDIADSDNIKRLRNLGIDVVLSHKAENVQDYDLLVYNARIKEDNPERVYAYAHNMPVVKRAQMLGALMGEYKTTIGISGTHGKSTTSSMLSEIFLKAGKDPTFFIGAVYLPLNSPYNIGGDDYFILEADEYADSFLNFRPNISAVLNIEMDHPDYFKDFNAVMTSFKAYLANTKDTVILNGDDKNAIAAAKDFHGKVITYSLKDKNCTVYADNISYNNGYAEFDITANGQHYSHVKLSVPGEINIYNALSATACAYICGIDDISVSEALHSFNGAGRRFEYKGTLNGAKIYEDYAHHPTEIEKTLRGVLNVSHNKIWCVLQPHTYSRTYELMEKLVKSLSYADRVILTEIYSATEKNKYNISSKDIAAKTENAVFIDDFGEIAAYLKSNVNENDIVLIMGAGDINKLTKMLF